MYIILIFLLLTYCAYSQDGVVKTFYPNAAIESEINFRDGVRDGEARFYYENGNIKELINYSNGKVEGFVKIYSASGNLKETFIIENGRREGPTSVFDDYGNYLSDIYYENGKLVIPAANDYYVNASNDDAENNAVEEKRKIEKESPKVTRKTKAANNLLLPPELDEEKLEDDPAFFSTVEVMPEPVGGFQAIYKKLIYPYEAKKNNIEGTVVIKAFIDEYGEVLDAQVIQSLGYGCDDIARNAIYFAKFKPGIQKGKPVRVMMTIPINFSPSMLQNLN